MLQGTSAEAAVAELSAELNAALGRLYCIHGFTASAAMIVEGSEVRAAISFRCYECKQTMSYPPSMVALIDSILNNHAPSLEGVGLSIIRSIPKNIQ